MASAPKTPSLYSRMQAHGTLTEEPRDVPDARFDSLGAHETYR